MRRAALGLALMAMLAGCAGGTGAPPPLFPQIFAAGKKVIAGKRARKAQEAGPPVTRALLEQLGGTYLEVTLERPGITGYLRRAETRRDANPGTVTHWRTEDNITLSFRNGVLIATRGMGGDIMSAEVPVAEGVTGPASGGERALYVRTGDLQVMRLALACELSDAGPETVAVLDRSFATRHLQEYCTTAGVAIGGQAVGAGEVRNDYWVDSRAGIVRRSRQWGGPEIGYMVIRQLNE